MSKVMRCKFRLHEVAIVQTNTDGSIAGVKVKLGAVYEPDEKKRLDPANENAIFGKYSPHGAFEATIYNEHVAQELARCVGREFYLDFTLAPLPEAVPSSAG